MKASLGQFLLNLHNLGMIPCFQSQLEEAAGDGHVGIGAVVVYRDHISPAAGNDFRDFLQLARFVCQGNGETDVSSAGQKPRVITRLRILTSMFPPETIQTTFFPSTGSL